MKRVKIIGAGQLGSRHLQALKAIPEDLAISVVDPSSESLRVAKERYEAVTSGTTHPIEYEHELKAGGTWDLVIVATNANVRRPVVEQLLATSEIRNLVLEKILFPDARDYEAVTRLVTVKGTKAWVNCCMRQMDIYSKIRERVRGRPVHMSVTGSRFGLVTNAIHYFDYLAWITGSTMFTVDSLALQRQPVESKRKGYLEFNGTLSARFGDGSFGVVTCFEKGALPGFVEIHSTDARYLVRESERKAWVSEQANGWGWTEIEAPIPFQSQLTAELARSIFESGHCALPTLEESSSIHLQLLRPLAEHLRAQKQQFDLEFPFT